MHIIITDSKRGRMRSFELGAVQLLVFGASLLALMMSALVAWWPNAERAVTSTPQPTSAASPVQSILDRVGLSEPPLPAVAASTTEADLLQQNIDALAKRLGVMQARMIQLQALSERLAQLAGVPKPELDGAAPGEGGALVEPQSMSAKDLSSALESLAQDSEEQFALLSVIEDSLLQQEWAHALTPGRRPVDDLPVGSRFGRRIDPITGKMATHTGLDFPGPLGTPIRATAGGMVVFAGWHAGYGRLVELDHGNGVVTRYAHLKAFKVAQGDVVRPGQTIGLLGNSGRSTGPHLHFEVWVGGRVRNPATYLRDHARLAQAP